MFSPGWCIGRASSILAGAYPRRSLTLALASPLSMELGMVSTRLKGSSRRLWLAISLALFLGATYFVAVGHRELHDWLLLVGTFANVMVFRALWRRRAQAG